MNRRFFEPKWLRLLGTRTWLSRVCAADAASQALPEKEQQAPGGGLLNREVSSTSAVSGKSLEILEAQQQRIRLMEAELTSAQASMVQLQVKVQQAEEAAQRTAVQSRESEAVLKDEAEHLAYLRPYGTYVISIFRGDANSASRIHELQTSNLSVWDIMVSVRVHVDSVVRGTIPRGIGPRPHALHVELDRDYTPYK